MRRIGRFIKQEFLELLPIWIYIFFGFALISLTEGVTLKSYGIERTHPSSILIGSLIVAKVFLIVDKRHFTNRFDGRPLILNTVWKTFIYSVGSLFVKYLEELYHFSHAGYRFVDANRAVLQYMTSTRFYIIDLWLVVLLFAFCAVREMILAMGKERFLQIFFGIKKPLRLVRNPIDHAREVVRNK